MSEYDDLLEGYDSSLPAVDPGPLTDEEHQALQESIGPIITLDLPADFGQNTMAARPASEIVRAPYAMEMEDSAPLTATEILESQQELRVLRGDQLPAIGKHYVIFGGIPHPVTRAGPLSEDEFVRSQLNVDGLKDDDGGRRVRADRTLRMRYRGYVCGQTHSL